MSPEPLPPHRREDISYPPVVDGPFGDEPDFDDDHDPRMAQKRSPEAARRRAQLARYVKAVVGASAVLCLAAFVKTTVAARHAETGGHRAAAVAWAAPPAVAPVTPPAPAPEPATATAPEAALDPAPDPKAAAKEKRSCQTALERGKVAVAIQECEQSVSLDPTDAEAWLLLGATYQQKGDWKNAKRSFHSCLKQGKRGPKWECAQMPH